MISLWSYFFALLVMGYVAFWDYKVRRVSDWIWVVALLGTLLFFIGERTVWDFVLGFGFVVLLGLMRGIRTVFMGDVKAAIWLMLTIGAPLAMIGVMGGYGLAYLHRRGERVAMLVYVNATLLILLPLVWLWSALRFG